MDYILLLGALGILAWSFWQDRQIKKISDRLAQMCLPDARTLKLVEEVRKLSEEVRKLEDQAEMETKEDIE